MSMSALRSLVRSTLLRTTWGRNLIAARDSRHREQMNRLRLAALGDRKRVFTHHFESNEWRNVESVSGSGSTLNYTENIRREIPALLKRFDVRIFLDAPCGDFNWFAHIDLPSGVKYIGADIVESLIRRNQEMYSDEGRDFRVLDIVDQELPDADLWMCRDCLFHLSNDEIFAVLSNFSQSRVRYLLTSTHSECQRNEDIPTGGFREINLERTPFSLGAPILKIDDWIDGMPIRHLALWERPAIAASLRGNPDFAAAKRTTK